MNWVDWVDNDTRVAVGGANNNDTDKDKDKDTGSHQTNELS